MGMALANKMDGDPGRVYALLGDGELQEGLVWEAAMSAAHYKLDNLTAIVDFNGLQIDGKNDDVMTVKPIDKARACKGKPTAIIARTHKGKGVSFMEDQAGWHGKAPNEEEARQAVEELGGAW